MKPVQVSEVALTVMVLRDMAKPAWWRGLTPLQRAVLERELDSVMAAMIDALYVGQNGDAG